MNGELKRVWQEAIEAIVACFKVIPGTRLEELKKTMRNFRQDSCCPDRDFSTKKKLI
jgi:hypothetical protein